MEPRIVRRDGANGARYISFLPIRESLVDARLLALIMPPSALPGKGQ
jgi:hypothetical protein